MIERGSPGRKLFGLFSYLTKVEVKRAMEEKLSEMTLADVKKDIAVYTEKE